MAFEPATDGWHLEPASVFSGNRMMDQSARTALQEGEPLQSEQEELLGPTVARVPPAERIRVRARRNGLKLPCDATQHLRGIARHRADLVLERAHGEQPRLLGSRSLDAAVVQAAESSGMT
jgi:hypothetical protein